MSGPTYKRAEQAIFAEVGSDIVALNVERGQSYGMEEVAATVWQLLARPLTSGQLCAELLALYEVDPAVCRAEVDALLADFEAEGLIERTPS